MGKVKKMPSDYFSGFIKNSAGKEVTQISGSYLGYIDFDDIRYWTYDSVVPHKIYFLSGENALDSDHRKRSDLITLKSGDLK